ncbi:hypothetical protein [Actimicrobium sp. CCI2.3]|uniref:hypothetical protein n=1 Tax=Actimicrobium sp. CCI2.3 TaxID=3048616 RepID=UPI002AB4C826|nr:hypothetical protein [Actimicrobium sp. CCI2.3]MDY7575963.1 hypothetical protein [Actimicrobium sp. CCI2.3]
MDWLSDRYCPDFKHQVRHAWLATCLVAALIPVTLLASPVLRCELEQGGVTRMLDVTPTDDPYRVRGIDINGRFRFKAVMIGNERQVDYIKLYTYGQARNQSVLLHQATYPSPSASPASLTGIHFVYAPDLERELQYQCTLLEVAS